MPVDVALVAEQQGQSKDKEAAAAREDMAKAKQEQVRMLCVDVDAISNGTMLQAAFESKQKLMQTELENKLKEHAKLHAKLASAQAELVSIQRGLKEKEERVTSQVKKEQVIPMGWTSTFHLCQHYVLLVRIGIRASLAGVDTNKRAAYNGDPEAQQEVRDVRSREEGSAASA
jgi:hypothetical protein